MQINKQQKLISLVFILIALCCSSMYSSPKFFTIMLDPSGDARNAGRAIDDSFERGITLQYAEQLKKHLEELYRGVRVIITRFPGETVQPLQHANFANRLSVDLYLSIHFYHETKPKPHLSLFTFSLGNEPALKNNLSVTFVPVDLAHKRSQKQTLLYAQSIRDVLSQDAYQRVFDVHLFSLPFKPLMGITAPALAFEGGLKHKDDWRYYIEPITHALDVIIRTGQHDE